MTIAERSPTSRRSFDGLRRLHVGCGSVVPHGWFNSDIMILPGIDICFDMRQAIPIRTASVDYATSQHALQQLRIEDIVEALKELYRVLKPGGVLRLCLPDFDKAVVAYQRGGTEDLWCWDWNSTSGNLISQIIDCNSTRTPLTADWTEELLKVGDFDVVQHVSFMKTASRHDDITTLDSRPDESFCIEGFKVTSAAADPMAGAS